MIGHGRRTLVGTSLGSALSQRRARSLVERVQTVSITIAGGSLSNTGSPTVAVDLQRTLLQWGGIRTSALSASVNEQNVRVELTNSTTITATRENTGSTIIVKVTLVTYAPGVLRGVQRGTITIANLGSSNTATITAVSTKADARWLGTTSPGATAEDYNADIVLTNTTTVTSTRTGTGNTSATTSYEVADWL